MPTLGKIIAETRYRLAGLSAHTERVGELNADIDADEVNIPFSGLERPAPGVYEIDFEKIRVRSASESNLTTYTFGRGYDGSVATSHA